jgi:signal transduction histidine kinase/HAMP domain-containing protein
MGRSDPDKGKKRARFGIHRKVFATFLLAYAVVTVSSLYIVVVNIHRMVEEEATTSARHRTSYFAAAVSRQLAEREVGFLTEYLGNVVKDGDIEYARIEGPAGEFLAEAGLSGKYPGGGDVLRGRVGDTGPALREIGAQEGIFHEKGHLFLVSSPVMFQGKPVGRVILGLDTVTVSRRLAAFTYRILEIAVGTILAGIAVTFFLYRRLGSAMKELISTTGSFAGGNLDRRASVDTGDQLEDLAGAFNRMAQAVAGRERELRDVRNTMVAMFDGITEGIAHVGSDHRILHANRAYAVFRGRGDRAATTGRMCHELLWGERRSCGDCPGSIASESGSPAESEREFVLENGDRRVVRIRAYPVVLPGGGSAGFVEYVSDITRQRKMEEELIRYATNLEEVVRERTLRLQEAHEKMIHREKIAALGQMAAGVAHEIGNPLSALSSLARNIASDSGREGGREKKLRLMQDQIDRIVRIVRELVDFSRPSSFGKSLIHVNEVLRTALGIARYDERFKGVHVITGMDPDIPALKMDGDQLLQVFLNILFNAGDAMRGSGTLTISSRRKEHSVALLFGDSGPGIAEESLPRIFEPFYTTKEVGKGTGLGLSVSYGIVQGMGGAIRASNLAGAGALFTVELPLPEGGGSRG